MTRRTGNSPLRRVRADFEAEGAVLAVPVLPLPVTGRAEGRTKEVENQADHSEGRLGRWWWRVGQFWAAGHETGCRETDTAT